MFVSLLTDLFSRAPHSREGGAVGPFPTFTLRKLQGEADGLTEGPGLARKGIQHFQYRVLEPSLPQLLPQHTAGGSMGIGESLISFNTSWNHLPLQNHRSTGDLFRNSDWG